MKPIATIIALFLSNLNIYSQQIFDFNIDGLTKNFTTCEIGTMEVNCSTTYQGAPNIVWTIYKDNKAISITTVQAPFRINGTNKLNKAIPRAVGEYRVERKFKNISSTTYNSYSIQVLPSLPGAVVGPAFTINSSIFADYQSDVYNVSSTGPIKLDGASVSCTYKSKFYVSIQLSDIKFGRYNQEAGAWFDSASNAYGSLSDFNLKAFAQKNWFAFHPGQYYRVKIAYGSPWQEFTRLIKIN